MLKFNDGPASGKTIFAKRAPLYLRVAIDADGEIDVLDQLGDVAKEGEVLFAYKEVGTRHVVECIFKDRVDESGIYSLVDIQPSDTIMRSQARWETWVVHHHAESKLPPKEPLFPKVKGSK